MWGLKGIHCWGGGWWKRLQNLKKANLAKSGHCSVGSLYQKQKTYLTSLMYIYVYVCVCVCVLYKTFCLLCKFYTRHGPAINQFHSIQRPS